MTDLLAPQCSQADDIGGPCQYPATLNYNGGVLYCKYHDPDKVRRMADLQARYVEPLYRD